MKAVNTGKLQWYLDDSDICLLLFFLWFILYIEGNHYLSENRIPKEYIEVMVAYFYPLHKRYKLCQHVRKVCQHAR